MKRIGSFQKCALDYIEENPGCCKMDVVKAIGTSCIYGLPNRTIANRYISLHRLIRSGLIKNKSRKNNKYELYLLRKEL